MYVQFGGELWNTCDIFLSISHKLIVYTHHDRASLKNGCTSDSHFGIIKPGRSQDDMSCLMIKVAFDSSSPGQNGRHFAYDICTCLNANIIILIRISLNFAPKGPFDNKSELVQTGDKPLAESMMVRSPMHIYVTRPQ